MDAFWTEAQTTFRRKARDYFRRDVGLLGEAWTRDNLPGDEFSSECERNQA